MIINIVTKKHAIVFVLLFYPVIGVGETPKLPPATTEKNVRLLLSEIDTTYGKDKLHEAGERVYPIYLAILNDKSLQNGYAMDIYAILSNQKKYNRKMFIEKAVSHLANDSSSLRAQAAIFLKSAGSESDAIPLVPLLFDEDIRVGRMASGAMAEIGGERTLAAFDIWLKFHGPRAHKDLLKQVAADRTLLANRLANERNKSGEKRREPGSDGK